MLKIGQVAYYHGMRGMIGDRYDGDRVRWIPDDGPVRIVYAADVRAGQSEGLSRLAERLRAVGKTAKQVRHLADANGLSFADALDALESEDEDHSRDACGQERHGAA